MKKILSIIAVLLLVLLLAGCGNSQTTEEKSEAEEPRDVLAGTTYELVSVEFEDTENGGMDALDLNKDQPTIYKFGEDGTYVLSYWDYDVDYDDPNVDLGSIDWENTEIVEKEESGTYSVDGDKVTISGLNKVNENATEEEKAIIPEVTLKDDTIIIDYKHTSYTDENGETIDTLQKVMTYSKVE